MTRKQKRTLVRILAAAVLLIAASLIPQQIFLTPTWVIEFSTPGQPTVFPDSWTFTGGTVSSIPRLLLFLVPYFVIGWDILWKAVRNIAHGQVFDENFLMCIATIGALVDPPATCINASGDTVASMIVARFVEGKDWFQKKQAERAEKAGA